MKKLTFFLPVFLIALSWSAFAEETRDWRQDDGVTEWNKAEQEVQSVNAQTEDAIGEIPVAIVDAELEALRRDFASQMKTLVEQIHGAESHQEAEALELEVRDLKESEHIAELQFFYEKAQAAGKMDRAEELYRILQEGVGEKAPKEKARIILRDSRTGLALDPSEEEGGQK